MEIVGDSIEGVLDQIAPLYSYSLSAGDSLVITFTNTTRCWLLCCGSSANLKTVVVVNGGSSTVSSKALATASDIGLTNGTGKFTLKNNHASNGLSVIAIITGNYDYNIEVT